MNKEETRAPDAEQKAALEDSAFAIWYSKQKADVRHHPRPRRSAARRRADAATGRAGRCWTRSSPRPGSAGASTRPPGSRRGRRRAAGRHARGAVAPRRWSCRRRRLRARGARARRPPPLPGRHGPGGTRPARRPAPPLPARPPGRAASASPDGTTVGDADGRRPRGAAVPRAGRARRQHGVAVGHALDLGPAPGAGRLSLGPRADPPVAPQPPPRGGVRGLRRARGAAPRRSSPGSSATCCSRSSSTRSSRPRRASST